MPFSAFVNFWFCAASFCFSRRCFISKFEATTPVGFFDFRALGMVDWIFERRSCVRRFSSFILSCSRSLILPPFVVVSPLRETPPPDMT